MGSLSDQGISSVLVQAVDGRHAMPALNPGESLHPERTLRYRRAPLTSSEVGCYLSHLRLIRKAFEQNAQNLFILEDDVRPEPGLAELVDQLEHLPPHMHLVRLMGLKLRKRRVLQSLTKDFDLVRPTRGALGTQGYVLNRQGMQKVLQAGGDIIYPIDKLYDSFFLYGLNCYSVEPHALEETAGASSVQKHYNEQLPLRTHIGFHANKLHRSLRRRVNYLANYREFAQASKPLASIGKSARLRD